jgi:hypothetical protein
MYLSTAHLSPLLSILFGILILVFPRLLNYLVAIYLILAGLLGIGLIGRPLRAHAQFDQLTPAAVTPACRPPADLDAALAPRTSPSLASRPADRPKPPRAAHGPRTERKIARGASAEPRPPVS